MAEPVIGGIYKHVKGGTYVVSEIGTAAWDGTTVIVGYVDLKSPRTTWFRAKDDWNSLLDKKERFAVSDRLKLTVDEIAKLKHRDQDMTPFVDFLFDNQSVGNSFSSIQTLLGLLS